MTVSEFVDVLNKNVMFEVYESNGEVVIFDSVRWNHTAPGNSKVTWISVKDKEVEEFNILDTDKIFIFVKREDK